MKTLERSIRAGLIGLLALMPFHAFLSVWLGHTLGLPTLIQSWKEVLIAVLAVLAGVLVWREPGRRSRLRQPWILAAGGFATIALLVTGWALATRTITPAAAVFGAKTDLEFLAAAIIAGLVTNPGFARRAVGVTVGGGLIVAVCALAQSYLLPPDFLVRFGYGPETILPYLPLSGTSGTPRFGATLGGPNQLGAYLVVIASLVLAVTASRRRWLLLGIALPAIGLASYHTYSRSAWIGLGAALTLTGLLLIPRRHRRPAALGLTAAGIAAAALIAILLPSHPGLQQSILHASATTHDDALSSDSLHALSLRTATTAVLHNPFGSGLGSAGPATFHTGTPNIIENQFLQIGYETGWLGLGLFLAALGLLSYQLIRANESHPASLAAGASLVGIGLAGLFIPTFGDSTTALVSWTLAGTLTATRLHPPKPGSAQHV